MEKQRNSRWGYEPRPGKDGKPIVVTLCESDLKIFQVLNRYRYLPIDFIAALTGLSYDYLKKRLDALAREPNRYLNRPEQQANQPHENSRFLTYENSDKGEKALADAGLFSKEPLLGDKKLFGHGRLICDTLANIELGGRPLMWFADIERKRPGIQRFIPVHIEHNFSTNPKRPDVQKLDFEYYNDSNGPFGVCYDGGLVRFCSLEAERTTDCEAGNIKKTSFLKKLLAIMYIQENKLYRENWGIPNLMHLVVCPSQARIDTRKELILKLTNGKGLSYIAFAVVPDISDPFRTSTADSGLFTRPWQRAGHPDFYLDQPTAKKAAA